VTQPKRRNLKAILIVVGSVLAVCCVLGGLGIYFGVRAITAGPRDATDAFLRDLTAGNSTAVYDRLCESTRSRTTKDQLVEIMNGRRPTSYKITGVSMQSVNGDSGAAVRTELSYPGGTSEPHTFRLRKEGGEWKVCGDPY